MHVHVKCMWTCTHNIVQLTFISRLHNHVHVSMHVTYMYMHMHATCSHVRTSHEDLHIRGVVSDRQTEGDGDPSASLHTTLAGGHCHHV